MMHLTLLQIGRAVPTTPWELVTHSSAVTKLVLIILAILSLLSWAVMFAKWREFRRVAEAAKAFVSAVESAPTLQDARGIAQSATPSAFTRVFDRALEFLGQMHPDGMPKSPGFVTLRSSQVEALQLVLDSEARVERDHLGSWIPTLAVIGSASPLLGLLGTVLGVIDAFIGIATQGSGNIAAVAPGVAEALIATAVALATAIPAVFGYNIFAARLNRIENELEAFGTEIIAMLAREGHL